jgi:hypothetical protein
MASKGRVLPWLLRVHVGSLDEDREAILDLSCGDTLAWASQEHPFGVETKTRRQPSCHPADQSRQAAVSRRDVKLATRSRVKTMDVAIRVTTTYPAKWPPGSCRGTSHKQRAMRCDKTGSFRRLTYATCLSRLGGGDLAGELGKPGGG